MNVSKSVSPAVRAASALLCFAGSARADILIVEIKYAAAYRQTGAAAPSTEIGCDVTLAVRTNDATDLNSAVATDPGLSPNTLFAADGLNYIDIINNFTKAQALTNRPAGYYSFDIDGGTVGTRNASFNQPFPDGDWPPEIPAFDGATIASLHSMDPGAPLTLNFDAFTGAVGSADARTLVSIFDITVGSTVVFRQLSSDSTSTTIIAGTLLPGHQHRVFLTFVNPRIEEFAVFGTASTYLTFDQTTFFDFTTGAPGCVADFDDGSGTGTRDGGVTIEDLLYYLAIFTDGLVAADVDDGSATGTRDGGVTIEDLLYYLGRFAAGC